MSDRLAKVRNGGPPNTPVSSGSRSRSPLEADGDALDNNGISASVVGRKQLISYTSDLSVSLHNYPRERRDYVFAGVGLSVCLSVCLFVCLLPR